MYWKLRKRDRESLLSIKPFLSLLDRSNTVWHKWENYLQEDLCYRRDHLRKNRVIEIVCVFDDREKCHLKEIRSSGKSFHGQYSYVRVKMKKNWERFIGWVYRRTMRECSRIDGVSLLAYYLIQCLLSGYPVEKPRLSRKVLAPWSNYAASAYINFMRKFYQF